MKLKSGKAILIGAYIGAWSVWAYWGVEFLEVCRAFGGSYWIGLPDAGSSLAAWLLWPVMVALVYVLPVGLLVVGLWFVLRRRV
jgi:hypothetical protein